MEQRYEILNLSVRKLINLHGYIDASLGETLRLSKKEFHGSIIKVSVHGTNALFYQLEKLIHLNDDNASTGTMHREDVFFDVLIYLDFKNVFDEGNKKRLSRYESICKDLFIHGIQLELDDGVFHHFVPFIKSSSMSRVSVISFIRSDYHEPLSARLNFGLFKGEHPYVLSKMFAYQGLYMSSGKRIPLTEMDENSVIVIPDIMLEQNTKKYSTSLSKNMFKKIVERMFFSEDEEVYMDLLYYIDSLAVAKKHPKYIEFRRIAEDHMEHAGYYMYTIPLFRSSCVSCVKKAKKQNEDPKIYLREYPLWIYNDYCDRYLTYLGLDKVHHEDEQVFFDSISRDLPINMFDGEGVIDKELIEDMNRKHLEVLEPPYHHSIQFRLPFAKGVLHSVDLKRWFDDYHIDHIKDCFGIKRPVEKIKIILTESQFKARQWLVDSYSEIHQNDDVYDPMRYYFRLFHQYDHALYITNTDSITESGLTTLNYQILHTPDLFYHEFKMLLEHGNSTIVELATSTESQLNYFLNQEKKPIDRSSIDYQFDFTQDNVIMAILRKNPAFINQPLYQNRLDNKIKSLIKDMKIGRIPIRGTVRYLSGDLLDLMYRMTCGKRIPDGMSLKYDFYAPGLSDLLDPEKYYSITRNPHITSKELVTSRPIVPFTPQSKAKIIGTINDKLITERGIEDKPSVSSRWSKREEYFGHLKGVIMIDSYSNFMAAMQTADTDGDVVRLIFDEVYNEAVKRSVIMNKNRILFFPSFEPNVQALNRENMYDVVKKTFNSRIGIMTNDAFSKSIHAYNANSDDNIFKDKMRVKTELLSLIVSAELDAPKSGIAPHYFKRFTKNPFIKYKNMVESEQEKNINFEKYADSPNLYYLKDNAETLVKTKKRAKKEMKYAGVYLFEFQKDESWRKIMNKNLRNEIENLVMAFQDWDRQLGTITHMSPTKQSKALSTISHIISLQYDDTFNISIVENIIDKLLIMDIDSLISIQDRSIKKKWHLSLESSRENLLESLIPETFDVGEKDILMNFDQSGHKLLFLALSETINRINTSKLTDLSSFDTISRYRVIIEQAYNRHEIDGSKEVVCITEKILTGKCMLEDLIKHHVTSHLSEDYIDQENLSNYITTYYKKLSSYRRGKATLNEQNLKSISKHFKIMSSFNKHPSGVLRQTSSIRKDVYTHCRNELKQLFISHGVDYQEVIKYLYVAKTFDPSMKFMLGIVPEQVIDQVAPYDGEVKNNAE